ncbi:MAG: hypothetical protein M1837_005420 [Sclerophora amabilis]|nr:MAG: hypothetical protein M1837_005420 [Sclerophora amabilis]
MSNQDSTLKSYVDSATGAAQSALGSLTGNTTDKVWIFFPFFLPDKLFFKFIFKTHTDSEQAQGESTRDKAAAEKELSHTTAKAGPVTMSSSGAATVDDPNRTQGSWNQTVGSGKEMLGNLVGAEGLKQEGIQQNREGKGQEAEGQLSDLGSGIGDRTKGTVGGAVSGLMGDKEGKSRYQEMHDKGKTQQRGVEADLQKQADA